MIKQMKKRYFLIMLLIFMSIILTSCNNSDIKDNVNDTPVITHRFDFEKYPAKDSDEFEFAKMYELELKKEYSINVVFFQNDVFYILERQSIPDMQNTDPVSMITAYNAKTDENFVIQSSTEQTEYLYNLCGNSNYLFWQYYADSAEFSDIYMYNISSGEISVIAQISLSSQISVSEDFIIWTEDEDPANIRIIAYNIKNGEKTTLSNNYTGIGNISSEQNILFLMKTENENFIVEYSLEYSKILNILAIDNLGEDEINYIYPVISDTVNIFWYCINEMSTYEYYAYNKITKINTQLTYNEFAAEIDNGLFLSQKTNGIFLFDSNEQIQYKFYGEITQNLELLRFGDVNYDGIVVRDKELNKCYFITLNLKEYKNRK